MTAIAEWDSFLDIEALLRDVPSFDTSYASAARRHNDSLTKPQGALGRLETLACWLAGWQQRTYPKAATLFARVYAGNHGVTVHSVSAYPSAVTKEMVAHFKKGGGAVSQLSALHGVSLTIHEMSLDTPTQDITCGQAMDEESCLAALRYGFDSVTGEEDILAIGEMGIGNTTCASALCCALFGGDVADWVGAGTGLEGKERKHKVHIIETALAYHHSALARKNARKNVWHCLCAVGGYEVAAMVGALIAARRRRIPVILDGFVCCAAASCLFAYDHDLLSHCWAGHLSYEKGHKRLLDLLGLSPLLSLDMRLGEASGAVLALGIVRAAVMCHNGMDSFHDASVSDKTS